MKLAVHTNNIITSIVPIGLRQDQLGFKIQFHNKQGIYLRVSKPSQLREWLQQFSEAISYAHKNCSCNV